MPRLPRLTPGQRRFFAFAALSGCGWLLDTGLTLTLAVGAQVPTALAQMLGGGLACAAVYLVSRRGIFEATGAPTAGLALYLAYSAGMIFVAGVALAWMREQIHALRPLAPAGEVLLAKVMITPPILGINFLVARRLSSQGGRKSTKPDESPAMSGDSELGLDAR